MKLLWCILLFGIATLARAQDKNLNSAMQLMNAHKYVQSLEKINKSIATAPTSPLGWFCKYRWLNNSNNPDYQPDSALEYLRTAVRLSNSFILADSNLACATLLFCKNEFSKYESDCVENIYNDIKRYQNVKKLNRFIDNYPNYPATVVATQFRDSLVFQDILLAKDITRFEAFIKQYPNSKFTELVKLQVYELAYNEAKKTNTKEGYQEFSSKYPDAPQNNLLKTNSESQIFFNLKKRNSIKEYFDFLQNYPNSEYVVQIRNLLVQKSFDAAKSEQNAAAMLNFIDEYPHSSLKKEALKIAESLSYSNIIKQPSLVNINAYFYQFPEGVHSSELKELKSSLLKKNNPAFSAGFMQDDDRMQTATKYLANPILNKYFKNDTASLLDQLKRISLKSNIVDLKDWQNAFSKNSFSDYSTELFSDGKDLDADANPIFSSNGFRFYNQSNSEFGCECPTGEFDENSKGSFASQANCVISKKDSAPIHNDVLVSVHRTPLTYMFVVKNKAGKLLLFNSLKGNFVGEWCDEIGFAYLIAEDFPPNSEINLLLQGHKIFVGFKLGKKAALNSKIMNFRVLNSEGKELINPTKYPNPFPEIVQLSHYYECYNQPLNYCTCTESNGNYGSGFMQIQNSNGRYGIANATYDTLLIETKYRRLSDADEFGNVILTHFDYQKEEIYNLKTYKIIGTGIVKNNIERLFLPMGLKGTTYWIPYYENSLLNNSVNKEYCYDQNDYNAYQFQRPMIFVCKNNNGYELVNANGKIIFATTAPLKIHQATDSVVILEINQKHHLLIDVNGNEIWNPEVDYQIQNISNDLFVYGYTDNMKVKHLGLFKKGKAILWQSIFEEIKIEGNTIYGYKLGVKTELWKH